MPFHPRPMPAYDDPIPESRITLDDLALDASCGQIMAELWANGTIPEEATACLSPLGIAAQNDTDSAFGTAQAQAPALHLLRCAEGILQAQVTIRSGRTAGSSSALTVVAQGEGPAGLRVETRLRDAVHSLARDAPDHALMRIPTVADLLLPPHSPGLDHLGQLRWGLLARTMVALDHAVRAGAETAILLTHEIVSLSRTKEARRRNNREDLDRYVRRLSGGEVQRLERGVLAGPIRIQGIELFVGKVRRDLA